MAAITLTVNAAMILLNVKDFDFVIIVIERSAKNTSVKEFFDRIKSIFSENLKYHMPFIIYNMKDLDFPIVPLDKYSISVYKQLSVMPVA